MIRSRTAEALDRVSAETEHTEAARTPRVHGIVVAQQVTVATWWWTLANRATATRIRTRECFVQMALRSVRVARIVVAQRVVDC